MKIGDKVTFIYTQSPSREDSPWLRRHRIQGEILDIIDDVAMVIPWCSGRETLFRLSDLILVTETDK